jgi:hypothetical protein
VVVQTVQVNAVAPEVLATHEHDDPDVLSPLYVTQREENNVCAKRCATLTIAGRGYFPVRGTACVPTAFGLDARHSKSAITAP